MERINLNRFFIITFKPKRPELYNGRKRFSIGAGQLEKYLGKSNAQAVYKLATTSLEFQPEKKFRKTGIIKLYNR